MKTDIYISDRHFTLFDIVVSHSLLLLRSQKNNENKKNIDIIFFGTAYIQIFNRLKGIGIQKISDPANHINYPMVKKYLEHDNNHLFELRSNNESYYIAASFVKVFENQLDFNESCLVMEQGRQIEIVSSV